MGLRPPSEADPVNSGATHHSAPASVVCESGLRTFSTCSPPVRAMRKSSRTTLILEAEDTTAALEFASQNSDHPVLRIA